MIIGSFLFGVGFGIALANLYTWYEDMRLLDEN